MDCCNINCIAFCTQPDVVWQKGIYLDAWHAMALADRDLNGQQFKIQDALEVIHCACHQHYECLQPSSLTQCSFALICVVSFFLHPFIGLYIPDNQTPLFLSMTTIVFLHFKYKDKCDDLIFFWKPTFCRAEMKGGKWGGCGGFFSFLASQDALVVMFVRERLQKRKKKKPNKC